MFIIRIVHCLPWLPSINIRRVEIKHFIIPSLSSPGPVLFLTKIELEIVRWSRFLVQAETLHLEDFAMLDFGRMMVS